MISTIVLSYLYYTLKTNEQKKNIELQEKLKKIELYLENEKKSRKDLESGVHNILEHYLRDASGYISIKTALAESEYEIKDISNSLKNANDTVVLYFTGIIKKLDVMLEEIISMIETAEKDLLSFVSYHSLENSEESMTLKDSEHREKFISFIQKKYHELLQQIIDELVLTHKRKLEDVQTLDNIFNKVNEIQKLSEEVTEIANGIELISLNASIEAAHAGTEGKGFAVVSNEIRRLASLSESAAKKIKKELKDTNLYIKGSINGLKEAMDAESQYINSTIALIQDVFLSMTRTLFKLIIELTVTLMDMMGNTSLGIKNDINNTINTVQLEKYITDLEQNVLHSINKAKEEISLLGESDILNLTALKEFPVEELDKLKELLKTVDNKVQTGHIDEPEKIEEDDITFF